MMDGDSRESHCSAAAAFMRKSVENLLMTGQDVIGSSISSSLTLNAVTMPGSPPSHQNQTPGEASPAPSPQASPRPSTRLQHKRDHSKGDSGSNTKESSPAIDRLEVSSTEQGHFMDKFGVDENEKLHLGSAFQTRSSPDANGNLRKHSSSTSNKESGSSSRSTSCSSSATSDTSFHTTEDNVSRCSDSSQVGDLSRSVSHESSKDRKESRGSDRSKKKSSWYNILYPTYKSRSEDFKRIFKDVPSDERLIVDYSCAVAKEILIHGRLYVSQNFICFYANIFRWETLISLQWKDVTAITKEKTALVIPNAILVCTESEKLFFTSFGARDKAYLMLFRVWQNALMDQQMSMQEMWQWVHSCYGQELGLTSEDEDYVEPLSMIDVNRLSIESFSEDGLVIPEDALQMRMDEVRPHNTAPLSTSELANMEMIGGVPTIHTTQPTPPPETVTSPITTIDANNTDAQLETDMSDTTESEPDKRNDNAEFLSGSGECTSPHEGREMVRVVLPASVDQLFTLLFTNSKFFVDFHLSRSSSNIKPSPWTQNANNQTLRTLCLTVHINQSVVGRRQSQVTETQAMLKCSKPGKMYAIDSETSNAGIPYADSFVVATHYCLNKVTDNESSLVVYADVKYKKSVWSWVKTFIEKHTWVGLEEFYSSLIKALQAECGGDEEIPEEEREVAPKMRRRLRTTPRRLSTARLGEDVVIPRSRSSIGRRSLPRGTGSVGTAEHSYDIGGTRPANGTMAHSDNVNLAILGILMVLLLLNGVLYYKLWCLEQWSVSDPIPASLTVDLNALSQNPPSSQSDWLRLLRQQESLHSLEMQKWQKVLRTSVILLRQTEDSLKELQMNIQPRVKHKLMTVIQELSNSVGEDQETNSEL